ncbi:bifunctional DedA family/phosphatase PAP2 family protein [Candidatus Uhrbacteria bacterium]|nr:bifunctional DedA family/phosphatase PAP2 family protein [Candidatus Uhrbacteria bacterium]
MLNAITPLLPQIQSLGVIGYWILLLITLLESLPLIGVAVPGTVALVLAGFIAVSGPLDLGDLIWFGAIGAIIGDGIAYQFGIHPKTRTFFLAKLPENIVRRGESFIKNHGGKSVFLGRFIGPIRPFISFLAGMLGMSRRAFYVWDIASGFVWTAAFLILGALFGQAWQNALLWSSRMALSAVILGGAIVVLSLIHRWIYRHGGETGRLLKSLFASIIRAIKNDAEVKKFVQAHPALMKFLHTRLQMKTFTGLPLTLLIFAAIYVAGLYIGLIEDVLRSEPIVNADVRIGNILYFLRDKNLTNLFFHVTQIGEWKLLTLWAVLISIALFLRNKITYVVGLWTTLIGGEIFVFLSKSLLHRARPTGIAVYVEESFSFPSGHAAMSVLFYGFVAYLAWRLLSRRLTKLNSLIAALALMLVIGFSRLYLGVHFLSDVLGGYLIGTLWLIIGIVVTEWMNASRSLHIRR